MTTIINENTLDDYLNEINLNNLPYCGIVTDNDKIREWSMRYSSRGVIGPDWEIIFDKQIKVYHLIFCSNNRIFEKKIWIFGRSTYWNDIFRN